jgi:beta-glucosidase
MTKLTLEDKIKLTSGQSNWHFLDNEQLDHKPFKVADGPHGVRVYLKQTDGDVLDTTHVAKATLFPSASAMASSWHPELLETVGQTIAKECRYYGIDGLLGPGINLKRSPLGGRNFEYYSEDPYLTKEMAVAFVNGVQSEGVAGCIKHFGLNEQETMRRFVDTIVDERTMHEMYLYPFRKVIEEANPRMVMSAYNKLNGTYASESKTLLKDVLRDQWHYDGVVISDWGAVQDKVQSIKNGMNVEMPGPSSFEADVYEALQNGVLTEEDIDASLKPLFNLQKHHHLKPLNNLSFNDHHHIAKQVADESIVLLENDGVLPLNKSSKVGVIGAFATSPRINGGGSATVKAYQIDNPLEVIKKRFKQVDYAKGYDEEVTNNALLKEVEQVAKANDILIYFTGTTASQETEGMDRSNLNLPKAHLEVLDLINTFHKQVVVVLSNGSALDLRAVKNQSNAILETWFLGGAGARSVVDCLTGDVNPSGRLQETFPLRVEHTPHYGFFPQRHTVNYSHDLILNGYRYYDTHLLDVLYPFGYGLSYSHITFDDIRIGDFLNNQVMIDITLTNHSNVPGYEVIQVYVKDHSTNYVTPSHALKAFKKVWVNASSSIDVQLKCDKSCFETYSVTHHDFKVFNGRYTIEVGHNSRDIVSQKTIDISHQTAFVQALDLTFPFNYFETYYPDLANAFESKYRPLYWYEKEEPFMRIIKRYKKHSGINQTTIDDYVKSIKEAIKNV